MRKNIVLIVTSALMVLACHTVEVDVAAKKAQWQLILDKEIPVGSTRQEIEAWGRGRGLSFEDTIRSKDMPLTLIAMVERTRGDGVVCKDWQFFANIELGPDGRSTKQNISGAGRCS